MKPLFRVACVLAFIASLAAAKDQVWQTTRGAIEGRLSAVYGPLVVIARSNGSSMVSMDLLGDAELERVAAYLERHPAAVKWKESMSRLATVLLGRMQVLRDGQLVTFDPGDRPEPEFYLIYFGAFWCGPCRRFSPGFVKTYQRLQAMAPGRFEVVFVSSDESAAGQLDYVKEVQMPWPVLKFGWVGSVRDIERWEGAGIPCLVLLTRDGDLIYHTYHGSEYMGPQSVLDDFEQLLKATAPSYAAKKAMYRLAVVEHIRQAAGRSVPPKPYFVGLDPQHYQTLDAPTLKVTLTINEKGEVTDSDFEPKQSPAIDYSLTEDAEKWLFLPALKDGKPVGTKVMLPIKMR